MHGTNTKPQGSLIGAIDQGTTSTRFMIFSLVTGELVTYHQERLQRHYPHDGWVEQDADEIFQSVVTCIDRAVHNLESMAQYKRDEIVAIGITNQRETTVVWDKDSSRPLYPAILWCDTRTAHLKEELVRRTKHKSELAFHKICGLPLSTYFSALKLRWLLDEVEVVRNASRNRTLRMGTVDTWLLWRLTQGQVYATDVTNASRTMLMNLHRMQWDSELCKFFRVDLSLLPQIRSSAENYGSVEVDCALRGVPITGIVGDQQAALIGQGCLRRGMAKNTYGTGCFLLCHTGEAPVFSEHGLLTTVAYQLGPREPVCYALEGSVAAAGATMSWLRDNLNLFTQDDEIELLARSVNDTAGCYLVPAFTGLLCPYWKSDARGVIVGLSHNTQKPHVVRAGLEAVCFQSCDVLSAMNSDLVRVLSATEAGSSDMRETASGANTSASGGLFKRTAGGSKILRLADNSSSDEEDSDSADGENEVEPMMFTGNAVSGNKSLRLTRLRVDGGMVTNELLLQLQADLSGLPVERPIIMETTSLGAAIAAAHGIGAQPAALRNRIADTFQPSIEMTARHQRRARWLAAVKRSFGWSHGPDGSHEKDDNDSLSESRRMDGGASNSSQRKCNLASGAFFGIGILVGILLVQVVNRAWK